MLSQLAIADSDPHGDGNEIVIMAIAGLLIGGALVVIGSQNPAPAVGVNCPNQPCSNGTVCNPATGTCVTQGDGGGGSGCSFCGGGICCPPWVCDHAILGGTCFDPNGSKGSGQSQCLMPCASSGLVCNPHTHQCDHGSSLGWSVNWGGLAPISFIENVNPIVLQYDNFGVPFAFPLDAGIQFTYVGPGGSATAGFSLRSEEFGGLGLCQYAFSSLVNLYLDPATSPTSVAMTTEGIVWPENCSLCLSGLVGVGFTVWPYVVLPDGPHYGPAFQNLLSC